MLTWKDYYAQEELRQYRMKEAKQERLIRMFRRDLRDRRQKAWIELLGRIGYRLVEWGDAVLRFVAGRQLAS